MSHLGPFVTKLEIYHSLQINNVDYREQMIRPIIVVSKKKNVRFVVPVHESTRSDDLKTNGLDPDKPHFPRENVQACATTMSPYSSFFSTINCPEMVENAEYSWIPAYNNGKYTPHRQISKENQTRQYTSTSNGFYNVSFFLSQKGKKQVHIHISTQVFKP